MNKENPTPTGESPWAQDLSLYPIPCHRARASNIARLDNALAGIEAQRDAAREELENAKQQFATAQEQVERPFPQEDELHTKSARLDELNIALNLDKRDNEDMDDGEELPKAG